MTKSVTKIQDKDTRKRLSVVRSTEDPTKYGIVIVNPDGSKISGPQGEKGDAATVRVGTTCTGEPGTCACVSNSGDCHDAVLNFTIPKGCKGDTGTAATISVGSTTTLDAGCCANVSNSGTSSAAVLDFCIPKGDKGDTGGQGPAATISIGTTCTGNPGTAATVTNSGTSQAAVFNFTIPQGVKGETGNAATVSVGTTSTLPAGCCATVTNVGNCHCAVLNFAIPQGPQGCQGPIGCTGPTGNGISCVTSSKVGKVTTVDICCTNGCYYCFEVCDGNDGEGAGDVLGPASSTNGNVVLFDGGSGKCIKDSGKKLPDVIDSLCCNSTTDALSANQGRELKSLIDTYVGLGRFLSLWDASTGQPISFPLSTPYTYKTGDWFMVEIVGTTNYKPNGSSYTGSASTTVDSVNNVEVRDVYIYDGTDWLFQKNNETQVSFSDIAGVPTDNACLCSALDSKQDTLSAGVNINITSNKVSATNNYIITEDITCTTYTGTTGVAPYNNTYCYTNICINPDSGVVWREGSVYTFDIDTKMIATSACRNVRVKIGDGAYIPVMGSSSILGGSSYFTKANTRQYMYSTKYQSGGALHLFTDSNTTYSAMSNAEATTGTCTSARSIAACTLKCAINYYAPISGSAYGSGWDGSTSAPTQNSVYDEIESVKLSIPTIPANVSSFCNDAGYITSSSLPGIATSSVAGIVRIGSDTVQACASQGVSCVASRTYDIQLNSSCQAVVNVPWENTQCITSVNGSTGAVTVSEFTAANGGTKVFAYPSVNTDISDILSWLSSGGDVILKLAGSHQTNWYYRVTKINGDSSYIVAESMEGTNETVNAKEIFYTPGVNVVTVITDVSKNFFIPSNSGTQGQVLTKGASGYSWTTPSGGDVLVSTQCCNILTSGMKIWAGCQCDYENLGTYDCNTVYLTI